MKIIEAMKRVKANNEKIGDLQNKIANNCSKLNVETSSYNNPKEKITEWLQSCDDLTQENVRLLCAISRTNLATQVTIDIGDKSVTKNIAEWVWRRRTYAEIDYQTWSRLTDRNLREGTMEQSTGQKVEVRIERHFDPEERDKKLAMYRSEPHQIDAALEVVNATTELIE